MSRKTEIDSPPAASPDWRDEAEARGRAAFEAAVAGPAVQPEPLSWLWRNSSQEETK
jgi:hypothetical protein